MAQSLQRDEDVQSVAAYVASLPAAESPPTLAGGDAARGREVYQTCAQCHGVDGEGNQTLGAPDLTHADDWYLLTQLENFRQGVRGADPRDTTGGTMRPMATALAGDQAMRDVLAYIDTLGASNDE